MIERDRDYNVALARSGSFMSSSINTSAAQHNKVHRKSSVEANGGAASDDSMHEKYFKSVENTPVSRRRHTTAAKTPTGGSGASAGSAGGGGGSGSGNKKNSSDSSPQSPISPQVGVFKCKNRLNII